MNLVVTPLYTAIAVEDVAAMIVPVPVSYTHLDVYKRQMLFHAGWATLVHFQGKRGGAAALKRERTFHRLSAAVWVAWLVPYVIGMLVGIPMIKLGTVPAVIASLVVAAIAAVLVFRPAKRS